MGSEEKETNISIAASAMGKKRWADLSEEQRNAAMEKARAERQRKLSKARRREIASVAAKARWAKVRAAEQTGKAVGETEKREPRKGGPGIP
ncbi:MAG: hypothetical protein ABSC63_13915 [Candidatus Binataceae bacterium]|jgi:TRAP-type C4-dicarboxylate transport system substrate-binding protein